MTCYYCANEITPENKSKEHIIPDALGGRLSSSNLLCKSCNDRLGDTIDAELFKQLGFVADIIGVERDRKKSNKTVKMLDKSGKPVCVGERMVPKPNLTFPLKGPDRLLTIPVKNGTLGEAASRKKKELEKARGEGLVFTEHQDVVNETLYLTNNLTKKLGEIGFGGKDYFRAIGKIALNYLLYTKPEIGYSDDIIELVRGKTDTNSCVFRYCPDHYMIHSIEDKEISHLLHIEGSREKEILYCYLELFNFSNHIIIFSREYRGDDFKNTYCFDTVKGQEIDKDLNLRLTRQHLLDMNVISGSHERGHQKKYNGLKERFRALQWIK